MYFYFKKDYSKGPNCRVGPIKSVGGPIFGRTYMAIRIYLVIWPNLGPNKVMQARKSLLNKQP